MYIAIIIIALAAAVRGQGAFYGSSGFGGVGGYGGGPGAGGQFNGGGLGAGGLQGGPQGSGSWLQGPQGRSINGQFNAPSQGQQPVTGTGNQAGLPVIFSGSPSTANASPSTGTAPADVTVPSSVGSNGAASPVVANAPSVITPVSSGSPATFPSGPAYAPNGQAGYGNNLWDSSPYTAGQGGQWNQGQNGFGRSYGGSPFESQGGYGGGIYGGQGEFGGRGGGQGRGF